MTSSKQRQPHEEEMHRLPCSSLCNRRHAQAEAKGLAELQNLLPWPQLWGKLLRPSSSDEVSEARRAEPAKVQHGVGVLLLTLQHFAGYRAKRPHISSRVCHTARVVKHIALDNLQRQQCCCGCHGVAWPSPSVHAAPSRCALQCWCHHKIQLQTAVTCWLLQHLQQVLRGASCHASSSDRRAQYSCCATVTDAGRVQLCIASRAVAPQLAM